MIEKTLLDDGTGVVLTFALPATRATGDVSVAGDFNDWQPSATPLRRVGDQLVGSVMVRSGRRYAFRYFCNGDWFNDESADGYEPNEYGGYDCVVNVT